MKKPNPEQDRRHERKPLLPEEWIWLLQATKSGRKLGGMSGAERALLYRVALETGLRAQELKSLKVADCYLKAKRPYLVCAASETKNGKPAQQSVTDALAADLRTHIGGHPDRRNVFRMGSLSNLARILRKDLAAARAAWIADAKDDGAESKRRSESLFLSPVDEDGKVLDFHGLRHTCGAWLAVQGAHPKTIQTVMRHSAITLTMDA